MRLWQCLPAMTWMVLLGLPMEVRAGISGPAGTADFLIDTQFAFTTSKSKLVGSNDTGTALRYGFGGYAGDDSNIAFLVHFDQDVTTFALNSSKIDMNWQDTRIRYHLGFFYLGALFTRLDMKVNSAGTETIDASGSGMGGNTGVLFGVGKSGSMYVDVNSATLSEMKNALDQTVSIKQRLDVDIGASIDLTQKLLDMTFGYKIRNLTVSADSSYKEILYTTYAGLRFSFFF